MSKRPPQNAPISGSGAPKNADLVNFMKNMPNLLQAERTGKLGAPQTISLRIMLYTHAQRIITYRFSHHMPHPLRNLTDTLNPTKPFQNHKALATEGQFDLLITNAESEMVSKEGAAVLALVEQSAKGSPSALLGRVLASTSAAASPSNTGGASTGGTNTPAPLAPTVSSSNASTSSNPAMMTNSAGATALKSEIFSAQEMRQFVDMEKSQREIILATPQGREKFSKSVQFWTAGQKQQGSSNQAANRMVARPPPPNTQSQQARYMNQSQQPNAGGMNYLNRQVPPPMQIPEELVEVRRKRKFSEYLAEVVPGMEMEKGVNEILEEVMDSFVLETAKGATRLAKHRKGDKVELKDIAFYLDKTHKIKVPGFDAQLAEKVRLPPEEKKVRVTRASAAAAKKAAGKDGE